MEGKILLLDPVFGSVQGPFTSNQLWSSMKWQVSQLHSCHFQITSVRWLWTVDLSGQPQFLVPAVWGLSFSWGVSFTSAGHRSSSPTGTNLHGTKASQMLHWVWRAHPPLSLLCFSQTKPYSVRWEDDGLDFGQIEFWTLTRPCSALGKTFQPELVKSVLLLQLKYLRRTVSERKRFALACRRRLTGGALAKGQPQDEHEAVGEAWPNLAYIIKPLWELSFCLS